MHFDSFWSVWFGPLINVCRSLATFTLAHVIFAS